MERVTPEALRIERKFDWLIILGALFVVITGVHLHFELTGGDWDFWTDWKDRRWWPVVTPVLVMMFAAAIQNVAWERFRIPIGATFVVVALILGEWISRVVQFHGWAWYPLSFVWPATMIPSALVLDIILMTTGSFTLTGIFGGLAWGILFMPSNYPMLAQYLLPVEFQGLVMSVADMQGYAFVRTGTPEYIRIIERGTLRTFGGDVWYVSAFFAGFASSVTYFIFLFVGRLFGQNTRFIKGW
jgi:methane/ammonia monooxygenase subunit A